MAKFCVLRSDPSDYRFYKVKSKHATRKLAEQAIPGRLRRTRTQVVVPCAASTKLGGLVPKITVR